MDTLRGEDGDDTFHLRDGEADVVNCGPGNDTALLDNKDIIEDATAAIPNGSCEKVVRKGAKSKEDKDETKAAEPEPTS